MRIGCVALRLGIAGASAGDGQQNLSFTQEGRFPAAVNDPARGSLAAMPGRRRNLDVA